MPIPVAERSKAKICGCLTAGIAGSNPAEGMAVRLLYLLCVVQLTASATSGSLVQRSRTCVCARVCVRVYVWVCM